MICLWGALHFVAFLFAFFIIHTFFLYNFYYFAFCICITAWFFFFSNSPCCLNLPRPLFNSEWLLWKVSRWLGAKNWRSLLGPTLLRLRGCVCCVIDVCALSSLCLALLSLWHFNFFFLIFAGKPSTVTTGDAKKNDGAAGAAVGDLQNYWVGG